MTDPVSIAGLSLAGVSLAAQAFNGSVVGLQVISKARASNTALLNFRTKLDLEIARLLLWGKNSGLSIDHLHESLQPVSPLLLSILGNIARSIESTDKLKSAYGIELAEDNRTEGARTPSPIPAGTVESLNLLPNAGLTAELRRHHALAEKLRSKLPLHRKVKWAVWNEARATKFVDSIKDYVNGLNQLLTESQKAANDQDFLAMKIALLGTSWNKRPQSLQALFTATEGRYNSLAQSAHLAQLRLEIEMEEVAPSPPSTGGVPALPLLIGSESLKDLDTTRSYAEFHQSQVIVEWTSLTSKDASGERGRNLMKQAAKLVTLFQGLHVRPEEYLVLQCVGYVDHRDHVPAKYGMVFAAPDSRPLKDSFTTLNDYLSSREYEDFQPSLGSRFELARQLTKAFLQFHQLGWLHKGIRSHNIVFFPRDDKASTHGPYILGFDYSRPNTEQGISDKPSPDPEFDLYRHPACQGEPSESFQLRYDLFSIGLLLFEIYKWRPLSNYRAKMEGANVTPSAFVERLISTESADLEFRMGEHYRAAVMTCLRGSFGVEGEDQLDKRLKLAFFEKVVKQLDKCHA
jgi:hypothetical protein